MKVAVWVPLTLSALLSLLLPGERLAAACAGFSSRAMVEAGRTPSLAYEQALIAFDPEKGREEFVREVVFRASAEPFGFVVPTPTRPHVSALPSPFQNLQRDFPFRVEVAAAVAVEVAPRGGGAKLAAPAVRVLEESKVGSFKTFVLAADDSAALTGWLATNGFVTVKASQDWLAHYVKLKFFYVAMRYEPHDADDGQTTAETIRISFDTPLPYYPYLEPELAEANARMLEVWLLSQRRFTPVALERRTAGDRWVQPLLAGNDYSATTAAENDALRASLLGSLGAEAALLLLPGQAGGANVTLQRFADQKPSRAGFGDIVFVPVDKPAPGAAVSPALARMAALLDPSLAEAP